MGQTLFNTQINNTYSGLLKLGDNGQLTAAFKTVSDGLGNDTGLQLASSAPGAFETILTSDAAYTNAIGVTSAGNAITGATTFQTGSVSFVPSLTSVSFAGVPSVDFTGATVTGLPGGAAGLVSGSATDSLKSDSSLTTVGAEAYGAQDIALGNNAITGDSNNPGATADCISIGNNIGGGYANRMIKIGNDIPAKSFNDDQVLIGNVSTIGGRQNTVIGFGTPQANGDRGTAIGYNAVTASNGVALGANSTSSISGAAALQSGVTASKIDTASVKALETQTPSTPTAGGIIMTDAGSTERRLNIDASGNLQVDSNPVGVQPTFVAPYFTHTGQASNDIVYTKVVVPGGTFGVGDVLDLKALEYRDGMDNWVYSSVWISDVAQTVGNATSISAGNYSFGQYQDPSSRSTVNYSKTLYITSAGTMIAPYAAPGEVTQNGGDPCEFYNINWSIDQTFFFQMWVDATVGTVQVGGISISKR